MHIQNGDDYIVAFIQKVPVNEGILIFQREYLAHAVLENSIDDEVREHVNCLPAIVPRSRF